jgi:hypothetical protein
MQTCNLRRASLLPRPSFPPTHPLPRYCRPFTFGSPFTSLPLPVEEGLAASDEEDGLPGMRSHASEEEEPEGKGKRGKRGKGGRRGRGRGRDKKGQGAEGSARGSSRGNSSRGPGSSRAPSSRLHSTRSGSGTDRDAGKRKGARGARRGPRGGGGSQEEGDPGEQGGGGSRAGDRDPDPSPSMRKRRATAYNITFVEDDERDEDLEAALWSSPVGTGTWMERGGCIGFSPTRPGLYLSPSPPPHPTRTRTHSAMPPHTRTFVAPMLHPHPRHSPGATSTLTRPLTRPPSPPPSSPRSLQSGAAPGMDGAGVEGDAGGGHEEEGGGGPPLPLHAVPNPEAVMMGVAGMLVHGVPSVSLVDPARCVWMAMVAMGWECACRSGPLQADRPCR